jgi:hypothetical protein
MSRIVIVMRIFNFKHPSYTKSSINIVTDFGFVEHSHLTTASNSLHSLHSLQVSIHELCGLVEKGKMLPLLRIEPQVSSS